MLEELKLRIANEKEVLSVLPQNNLRNQRKYQEKLHELLNIYQRDLNMVYQAIENKYKVFTNVFENSTFAEEQKKINDLYNQFYWFNEFNTSYEKMGLDHIIYNLRKFYKNNLDEVNNNINEAVDRFEEMGIKLNCDSFFYSIYATDYMKVFFEEKAKGNYNSLAVKENFEKLYWKCPDIIRHLGFNLIHIYYDNKRKIDKYFANKQNEVIREYGDYYTLNREYKNRAISLEAMMRIDKYNILNDVLEEKININDYTSEKIDKLIDQLVVKQSDDRRLHDYFLNFYNSLIEYSSYMRYEYIINDIKTIYAEKDKYKDFFKTKYKDISKKQSNIVKLNSKVRWYLRKNFGFDKVDILNSQINNEINELEKLHLELDNEGFKEKVLIYLKDNSSVQTALLLASSYYNYIVDCNKRNNIECDSTTKFIDDMRLYIFNPYNNVVDNLSFNSEENKSMIISDKYRLLDFKVTPDSFSDGNIENLISAVKAIIYYHNILKSGYKIEELIFINNCKKIIQSEENSVVASE